MYQGNGCKWVLDSETYSAIVYYQSTWYLYLIEKVLDVLDAIQVLWVLVLVLENFKSTCTWLKYFRKYLTPTLKLSELQLPVQNPAREGACTSMSYKDRCVEFGRISAPFITSPKFPSFSSNISQVIESLMTESDWSVLRAAWSQLKRGCYSRPALC